MRQIRTIQQIREQMREQIACSLEKYFQEIEIVHILEPEEEIELAQKSREGCHESRNKLVLGHLRFVILVAKHYLNQGLTFEDLINEGNLGLLKAAECFDETKGFKFISHAVWYIRRFIVQALADYSRLIRLPSNKIAAINKINSCSATLEQEFQRTPTFCEIAKKMETHTLSIAEHLSIAHAPMSMGAPISTDEDSLTIYDIYADEESNDAETKLIQDSLKIDIERLLIILNKREIDFLEMYYGLHDTLPMPQEEVARKMNITYEKVRFVKMNVLRKLREAKTYNRFRNYL